MKAFVFPGQASQFEGMGKDLYESSSIAKDLFEEADGILDFKISDIMFNGSSDDLKETKVTQPAVFLHSFIKARIAGDDFNPEAAAGHSLGEFSALATTGALNFEDALKLVHKRAMAMQKACEATPSTMAAILGLEDEAVKEICDSINEVVVPANYNCPGQLVISGSIPGIDQAVDLCKKAGARKAIVLQVGGAFHSPLMEPAKEELELAINETAFGKPICPIYQNVNALPETDPQIIKQNLIKQLTSPVLWTQTMHNMIADGCKEFIEVGGQGKTIRGFLKRVDRSIPSEAL